MMDRKNWLLVSGRWSLVMGLILAAAHCSVLPVLASGETFPLVGHDLQIDVDSRWAGCGQGGYCPVRVRVLNRGPARRLTFRIAKTYQPVVGVRQTLEVRQNETATLTLAVPLVNYVNSGEFRVEESGQTLENMKHSVSFPEVNATEAGRPGLLVVAPGVVDLQPFEDGATTFRHTGGGTVPFSGAGVSHGAARGPNGVVLPRSALPGSWIDYSGLDIVSIPLVEWHALPKGTRAALVQWTRCGGTLLLTAVGDLPSEVAVPAKSLSGDVDLASARFWTDPKSEDRNVASIVHRDTSGGTTSSSPPPATAPGEWPREAVPFRIADVGFGKLVAFRGEAFPGVAQDWFWLLKSVGGMSRWDWGKRHGESARIGTSDFLLFLIPGIGGVPVVMFLVLITIFAAGAAHGRKC